MRRWRVTPDEGSAFHIRHRPDNPRPWMFQRRKTRLYLTEDEIRQLCVILPYAIQCTVSSGTDGADLR